MTGAHYRLAMSKWRFGIYHIGIQVNKSPIFKKPPLWDATSDHLIPIYRAQSYYKEAIQASKNWRYLLNLNVIIEI